jgi:hypothetical protein
MATIVGNQQAVRQPDIRQRSGGTSVAVAGQVPAE